MDMIKSILKWLFIGMIVALILLWLWSGGWTLIKKEVTTLPNPVDIFFGSSTSTYQISLPWAISAPQGPDISGLVEEGNAIGGDSVDQATAADTQQNTPRSQAMHSGVPSPYQGRITLSMGNAQESEPDREYVEIDSRGGAAVAISGWRLESLLTGKSAVIPQAAQPLVSGMINRVHPTLLSSGQSAIVTTGASPVGVSFRENLCTGYLGQMQSFDPPLANACPSPLDSVPESLPADQTYGSNCFAFMRSIPQCQYSVSVPSNLSLNCRTLISNEFSYNGCLSDNQDRSDFALDTWRIYLGSGIELWDNAHDIIRLVDESGRVVDVISY